MSSSVFCPQCDAIMFGPHHRCPPQWVVRQQGDDIDWQAITRTYYANDPKGAAKKFVANGSHIDYYGDGTHVMCEVAPYPALTLYYTVTVSIELVYEYSASIDDEVPIPSPEEV